MNVLRQYQLVSVKGYEISDGMLHCIDVETGETMQVSASDKAYNSGFIYGMGNKAAKTYTPPNSLVLLGEITATPIQNGSYLAKYASPISKNIAAKETYLTGVKLDSATQIIKSKPYLFANILDANFENVRRIEDIKDAMLRALAGENESLSKHVSRGVLVRVGYQKSPTDKHSLSYEIYARANENPVQALQRTSKELPWFQNMLRSAQHVLTDTNGILEVTGFSRNIVNIFGKIEIAEQIASRKEYKEEKDGSIVNSYALTALSMDKTTGLIDKIVPVNKAPIITSSAGMVGRHDGVTEIPFQISLDPKLASQFKKQAIQINSNKDYPLNVVENTNAVGKRVNFKLEGSNFNLSSYQDRIENAAPGTVPFKLPNESAYVYPSSTKSKVLSNLSDLIGSPAIYTKSEIGRNANNFKIAGHIDKPPFNSVITQLISDFDGNIVNSEAIFSENDRVTIESRLGNLLTQPLPAPVALTPKPDAPKQIQRTKKSNYQNRLSYAEWMQEKFQNSPNELMHALQSDIAAVADAAGIDWSYTMDSIIIPSPGSKQALFKGHKTVFARENAHMGSVAVVANSYLNDVRESKNGPVTGEAVAFSLTFYNKKMDSGEGQEKFHSASYTWQLYRDSIGSSRAKKQPATASPEELKAREDRRQEKLAQKATQDKRDIEAARKDALLVWGSGSEEKGDHAQLVSKGISKIVDSVSLRTVQGRNPFYMYQIVDLYDNFLGLQKIHEKPWEDKKGKKTNKVYSKGITFSDPVRQLKIGAHQKVGVYKSGAPIYVVEGFSDAASGHLATGCLFVNALDKTNKPFVISGLLKIFPDAKIIDVADNDVNNRKGNVGVLSSLHTSWTLGVEYIIPQSLDDSNADINEVFIKGGEIAVQQLLQKTNSVPKNIVEYHRLKLSHVALDQFEQELAKAKSEILETYPNLSNEQIDIALDISVSQDLGKKKSDGTEVSTPLTIRTQINQKTKKPFLAIYDNTGDTLKDEISRSICEILNTKNAVFNSYLGAYVAPNGIKNILSSLLYEYTNAPRLYIGLSIEGKEGFVIRGNIDNDIEQKIDQTLGSMPHYYSDREQGVYVDDLVAIHLIKDAFSVELTPQNGEFNSEAIDQQTQQLVTKSESAISYAAQEFGVSAIQISKAQALILANETNAIADGYFVASAVAKIMVSRDKKEYLSLSSQKRYESLIVDAVHLASPLLQEQGEDFIEKRGQLLIALANKYGVLPEAEFIDNESENTNDLEVNNTQTEPTTSVTDGHSLTTDSVEIGSSETDTDERLSQLIEHIDLFVDHGYTFDEFFKDGHELVGSPYYDTTNQIIDNELLNRDLLAVHKEEVVSWPFKEKPRTLAAVFNCCYERASVLRLQQLEDFISNYLHTHGTTGYATFVKYFKGLKRSTVMSIVNPYMRGDELEAELFDADCDFHYEQHTQIGDIYREHLDKFKSEHQEKQKFSQLGIESPKSQLPLGISEVKVRDNLSVFISMKNSPSLLFSDKPLFDSGGKFEKNLPATTIAERVANSDILTIHKIHIDHTYHFIVSHHSGETDNKFRHFTEFPEARAYLEALYKRVSPTTPNDNAPRIFPNHEKATVIVQNDNVNQPIADEQDSFKSLMVMVKQAVSDELFYSDFYSDHFKIDGLFFNENPLVNKADGKLDSKFIKKILINNGHTSLSELYETHYRAVHNLSSSEHLRHRIGGYIPRDTFDEGISLNVSFDSFWQVIEGFELKSPSALMPFKQYLNTASAFNSFHPILSRDVDDISEWFSESEFDKADLLLLADVHQVVNINSDSPTNEIVNKIEQAWKSRRVLTFMMPEDLEALDGEELKEYSSVINSEYCSNKIVCANRIASKIEHMRETSHLRIAQYNYLKDAILMDMDGHKLPKYVATDIAKFNAALSENLLQQSRFYIREIEEQESIALLKETLPSLRLPNKDERKAHNSNEYTSAFLVGIKDPKYVTRGKYHYVSDDPNIELIRLPDEITYFTVLDEYTVGLPTPLSNEYLVKNQLSPINTLAIKKALEPFAAHLNNYGKISFEGTKTDVQFLFSHDADGYIKRTYHENDGLKQSTVFENSLDMLMESFGDLSYVIPDHDLLVEARQTHPLTDELAVIRSLENKLFSDSSAPDLLKAFNDSYNTVFEAPQTFTQETLFDYLSNYKQQVQANLDSYVLKGVDTTSLHASEQAIVNEAYSKTIGIPSLSEDASNRSVEVAVLELDAVNESTQITPIEKNLPKLQPQSMFDILHPTANTRKKEDPKPKVGMLAFDKSSLSVGIISNTRDGKTALKPLWTEKLNTLGASEQGQYIDPKTLKPYFLMSLGEFETTAISNRSLFSSLDLSKPWEENENQLNSASLIDVNTLASVLLADVETERTSTINNINTEISIRNALYKVIHSQSDTLSNEVQAQVNQKMTGFNSASYSECLETLNNLSRRAIAARNFERVLEDSAVFFGDLSNYSQYKEEFYPAGDIVTVSGLDLLRAISESSVFDIVRSNDDASLFAQSAFLQEAGSYDDKTLKSLNLRVLENKHWFEIQNIDGRFPTLGLAATYLEQVSNTPLHESNSEVLFNTEDRVDIGTLVNEIHSSDDFASVKVGESTIKIDISGSPIERYKPDAVRDNRNAIMSSLSGSYSTVVDYIIESISKDIASSNLTGARAGLELKAHLDNIQSSIITKHPDNNLHFINGQLTSKFTKDSTFNTVDKLIESIEKSQNEKPNDTNISTKSTGSPPTVLPAKTDGIGEKQTVATISDHQSTTNRRSSGTESGATGDSNKSVIELHRTSQSETISTTGGTRKRSENNITARVDNFRYPNDYISSEDWTISNRAKLNIEAIKIAIKLGEDDSSPNDAEKTILSKYTGWGGLSTAFSNDHRFYSMRSELQTLVSKEEFSAIKSSTLTSFYTPPKLMEIMWQAVSQLGFSGGKVLDPSTGIGGFMGSIPEQLTADTKFTAIEIDNLTAQIAKHLYSGASVKHQGFEKTKLPNDYYSLAISNVPFGNFNIFDNEYPTHSHKIHDYFFIKSLDKVAPGQLLAFITSTGTLDKVDSSAREQMHKRADLVAAIRLPSKMFATFAGTDVSTDIIFLKKRFPDETPKQASWLKSSSVDIKDVNGNYVDHNISNYFIENPLMIVGQQISVSGQYGSTVRVKAPEDTYEAIKQLIQSMPHNIVSGTAIEKTPEKDKSSTPILQKGLKPDSFIIENGELRVAIQKWNNDIDSYELASEPAKVAKTKMQRIISLVQLRDIVREHISLQVEQPENTPLFTHNLQRLNESYDAFISKYGFVNSKENKSVFKTDPDAPLILGLERSSSEVGIYQKTDIFEKRTISHNNSPKNIESSSDALMYVVAQTGRVDTNLISELTGRDWANIKNELGDMVYLDPSNMKFALKEHYLSGNIKQKLDMAKTAVELDERFTLNVQALESVMPKPISLVDIKVRLGSTWVPSQLVADFSYYIVSGEREPEDQTNVTAQHTPAGWSVHADSLFKHRNEGRCEMEFGTKRIDAIELINRVLNGSEITVKEKLENGKTVVNADATAEANDKARLIGDEFKQWIYSAPERADRLAKAYNDKYNVFVEAKYDGSQIKYTGLSPFLNGQDFTPRATQKDALMRFLVDRSVLLAHQVGTGKSFELVSMCIEGKSRGVVNKPLLAVPNNVFGQLGRLARQHYPNANIIMLDPRGMSKEKRANLIAQVAFNDWDMVLVPHSILNMIAAPDNFSSQLMKAQISELDSHISSDQSNVMSFSNKRLERRKKSLEGKLEKLQNRDSKDTTLFIDEMGIDALMVDESDNYINVPIVSSMGHVNGVNTSESMRATNLLYLARYIQDNNDGKNIVFATGTDIRKSMTDMYANLLILAPDTLRSLSVYEHDDYMSVFGEVVSSIEVSPEGTGYRENARLCKFNNLPEMAMLYRSVTDVVTSEMAGVVKPTIVPEGITVPGGKYFKAYMRDIAERSKSFRNGNKDEQWFSIMHDSKRAALDMRLIDANIPVEKSKLDIVASKVIEIFQEPAHIARTQLVFLDGFVHQTEQGFSPYDYLLTKLSDGGIPIEKLIDSRDVSSEAQKKSFEEGMDTARFAVAIGTTDKFGVGNNIQKYLYAMHEVNPPWNPRDMDQRKGRIERHGNVHKEAKIFRYVTEDSFDLFQWETMKRKASFISQSKVDPANAPREFSEDTDATYGDMMAIATGNPLFKEKMDVDAKLDALERGKRSHMRAQEQATHSMSFTQRQVEKNSRYSQELTSVKATLDSTKEIILHGRVVADPSDAKELIQIMLKAELSRIESGEKPSKVIDLGSYKGVEVWLDMTGGTEGGNPSIECTIGSSDLTLSRDLRPGAIVTALGNIEAVVDSQLEKVENRLAADRQNIEGIELALKPFEKDDELLHLKQEASRLETAVMESVNESLNADDTATESWGDLQKEIKYVNDLKGSLDDSSADLGI